MPELVGGLAGHQRHDPVRAGLDVHDRDQAVLLDLGDDAGEPVARRLDARRARRSRRRGLGEEPGEVGAVDEPLAARRAAAIRADRRRPSAGRCRCSRRAARRPGRRGRSSRMRDHTAVHRSHLQAVTAVLASHLTTLGPVVGARSYRLGARDRTAQGAPPWPRSKPTAPAPCRARSACSSTASSSRPRRASASTTSTRPPRRCSARSPTARADDMQRAIAAARRAFDETDWSTEPRVPQAVPRASCRTRSRASRRSCAPSSSPRSAARSLLTYGPQLDAPLEDGLLWPAEMIDEFEWERELPDRRRVRRPRSRRKVVKEPAGVVGAIVPWNFPFEVIAQEDRPGARHGQHDDPQAGARHAVERHAPRSPRRREDRHPARVSFNVVTSSDHLVGEELTISPLVDLISFTGSTATGKRIMEKGAPTDEAPVPRARRQVGRHRARRRRPRGEDARWRRMVCVHGGQGCAMPTRMLVPALAATTRRSRSPTPGFAERPLRRPHRRRQPAWAR